MPELVEQMYCAQQIVIPPKYPYILKRYAKAAIKTQPYDLLRWSFEYFKALAEHKTPPVKLRLEYPIFSTEGGLTRGYLKVLACQLEGMDEVPYAAIKSLWLGSCLDMEELRRILCLCEVYLRQETVPRLHFLAVAGGLLTKCLTHTMILLCETLTEEPEGGSAAIPIETFLTMYTFLAKMDASKDVKYFNGYREGHTEKDETEEEEEVEEETVRAPSPGEKLRAMSSVKFAEAADEGMIAGRQMSTTSGEFVVQYVEREIMAYIDEQIAVLPDPDLKKKKAKPEEVAMIRQILEDFLDDNMEIICPEVEEVEEEEAPIPEVTVVYAVPGIGPIVEDDIMKEFVNYAVEACKPQADMFMPRHIRHFLCPPLEKFVEHDYEGHQEEQLATAGAITD